MPSINWLCTQIDAISFRWLRGVMKLLQFQFFLEKLHSAAIDCMLYGNHFSSWVGCKPLSLQCVAFCWAQKNLTLGAVCIVQYSTSVNKFEKKTSLLWMSAKMIAVTFFQGNIFQHWKFWLVSNKIELLYPNSHRKCIWQLAFQIFSVTVPAQLFHALCKCPRIKNASRPVESANNRMTSKPTFTDCCPSRFGPLRYNDGKRPDVRELACHCLFSECTFLLRWVRFGHRLHRFTCWHCNIEGYAREDRVNVIISTSLAGQSERTEPLYKLPADLDGGSNICSETPIFNHSASSSMQLGHAPATIEVMRKPFASLSSLCWRLFMGWNHFTSADKLLICMLIRPAPLPFRRHQGSRFNTYKSYFSWERKGRL